VDQESVYLLGALAPDGEIELATTRKESLRRLTGRALERWGSRFRSDEERRRSEQTAEDWERELKEQRELPQRPFSLLELLHDWPNDVREIFRERSGIFFGLAEETPLGPGLAGQSFEQKRHSISIVSIGKQQARSAELRTEAR
jgi:hypothetical protein